MQNIFENYLRAVSAKFSYKETSEMGYRTDFENLLKSVFETVNVKRIDHDAKAKEGNKPDFAVLKNDVPIVYIEAKDIGVSLDKVEKSEQMARYFGYTNLVLTDYVEFRFYRNGLRYDESIKIANYDIKNRTISPIPENYEHVVKTLLDFTQSQKEPIQSGKHLSKIMGGRAQRIRDNVRQFLVTESDKNVELFRLYETFKKLLVHDLTTEGFADMYAQTLVYGLFVARYYDETKDTFSRQEARDLIPNSNPLLRHFFDHIVGPNFDKRLEYVVDELCEVFSHADIQELMKEYFKDDLFGKTHKGPDPVIHFYEDFLKEYDADLRKKMGAYYTPIAVVEFIVNSVDHLLEKDFGLTGGLADTTKTPNNIHKVQILDPAVGTGTFISAVIGKIYKRIKEGQQDGRWASYVHHDLLPRLHGFELMMTPYTIAHLKLGLAFKKTGFKYFNQRLGIYLTNSLENTVQTDIFTAFGFAESIAQESKEALKIKNDKPIMVVIGNPPYSINSSNKGEWILDLIKDYKKDLNERKINLDDDYIKFIRFAEHFIEKNKTGIVAMITNNSFIDGITHRQMRKHLLETFDDIYILDLHGNSKKKEKSPDGGNDENVFDIQQGVSINIFVRKTENKEKLGTVYHAELYGKREAKFEALNDSTLEKIQWQKLDYSEPYYFFVPKDFGETVEYEKGFKVDEFFGITSNGIETHKDEITIQFEKKQIEMIENNFNALSENEIKLKYNIQKEGRDWKVLTAQKDLKNNNPKIKEITYRPFDDRYTLYTGKTKGFLAWPRENVMKHMYSSNIALCAKRQNQQAFSYIFIVDKIAESCVFESSFAKINLFPLYLYTNQNKKTPNLNKEIWQKINKTVGETTPENILDYIYAVLHSPSYREKFKEFLKIDFPRVPFPKAKEEFWRLIPLGTKLRELHLMTAPECQNFITTFPEPGNDTVEKIKYENGNVFINEKQFFGHVPEAAWNFYIGGYQPAQKWLKDRKGRVLTNTDIEHYQKIIVVLVETDKLMKEIDKIISV